MGTPESRVLVLTGAASGIGRATTLEVVARGGSVLGLDRSMDGLAETTALVQAAWAASHTKNTYLAAQYQRLAGRRGRKRALIAVGHTLLEIIWHVLKKGTTYVELGPTFLDQLNPERLRRQLVKRLERLGHKVTLEPAA